MKLRLAISLLAALFLVTAAAQAKKAPDNRPKLAIVVVENLGTRASATTPFDRLDIAFHDVSETRKWPMAPDLERFAANTPEHETELRIYTERIRQDTPDQLTFRAWMTLTIKGEKHDFGVVTYKYSPRAGENTEDVLDKVYLGAANAATDKIEPLLFQNPAPAKP